jgi:hypothetical protein
MTRHHCSYGVGYSTYMAGVHCSHSTQLTWSGFNFPTRVLNVHALGSVSLWENSTYMSRGQCLNGCTKHTWPGGSSFLLGYSTCMIWDEISARMTQDATMTSDHVSAPKNMKKKYGMSFYSKENTFRFFLLLLFQYIVISLIKINSPTCLISKIRNGL